MTFKFQGPLGDVIGNADLYGALADRLAEGAARFSEIAALPSFASLGAGAALQAVCLLVNSGQVLPLPAIETSDAAPAQRLNRVIAEKMLQGRTYNFLAAPLVGSGIQATHTDLLMFHAVLAGQAASVEAMTRHVTAAMRHLGVNWLKDGQAVTDPAETEALVGADAEVFLAEKLPVWQRLGVV